MEEMRRKRHLFGGALRSAGLTALAVTASASADFIPQAATVNYPNYTFAYVTDGSYESLLFEFNSTYDAAFPTDIAETIPGGTVAAYSGPLLIGANLDASGPIWDLGEAVVWQYIAVDAMTEVLIEWNLGNFGPDFSVVEEVGVGDIFDEDSGAGSVTLTLMPGSLYHVRFRATSAGGNDDHFVRMTLVSVPAPGAWALATLGLLAGRRRRRE